MAQTKGLDDWPFTAFRENPPNPANDLWFNSGDVWVQGRRWRQGDGIYGAIAEALVELMEQTVGGHADIHDKVPFMFHDRDPGGGGEHRTSGQVWATASPPGIMLNVTFPSWPVMGLHLQHVPLKPPIRTVQDFYWVRINETQFEQLCQGLYDRDPDLKNVQLSTKTNAPDAGRDLSASRISNGNRIMIQSKHQPNRSINNKDLQALLADAATWTPPFDEVIVATTGTFTQHAIRWAEQRTASGETPTYTLHSKHDLQLAIVNGNQDLIAHLGLR